MLLLMVIAYFDVYLYAMSVVLFVLFFFFFFLINSKHITWVG